MKKKKEETQGETPAIKYEIILPKDSKSKTWQIWVQIFCSIATVIISVVALFVTIPNVINNRNEQTQVVIEPRDGDIIVKDGDDYKLLQLININDIVFPTKVQEIQYSKSQSSMERIDINNTSNADWSQRDSFRYVINSFSINPNKVINLLDNIKSIKVFCDFYAEKNITTYIDLGEKSFSFNMRNSLDESAFDVTKANVGSRYEYVTNELNDGIEWVKIRVELVYQIGNREISDTLTSDWIETDADMV